MSIFDRLWGAAKKPEAVHAQGAVAAPVVVAGQDNVDRRNRKRKNANRGAKALIIDDSATVVAALRKMLRSAGYDTREAADAEQGLALMAQEKPDLVFLDIVLPGMNGFNALRMIRKDPATQHIPVVMISGNEHATEQFYANRIGADDFMKKPFSRFEVFAHIETLLDDNRVPRRKAARATMPAVDSVTASVTGIEPLVRDTMPAPLSALPSVAVVEPTAAWSSLDARKELTAMGLQYFNQAQFFAAIRRGDRLAAELFIASGGISVDVTFENETALGVAQKSGFPMLTSLVQRHTRMDT